MASRETNVSIDDQAAEWVARTDRGPLSELETAALDAWLAADARRLGAYARAQAVYLKFDQARGLRTPKGAVTSPAAKRLASPWVVAAGSTLALALLAFVAINQLLPPSEPYRLIATQIGEIQRNPLADGSAITLNTATELKARLERKSRTVVLTSGEALFDVAADPDRPFRVHVEDITVTAVGTSFSVRLLGKDEVQVVVREGVVDVARAGARPIRMGAGRVLTWAPGTSPATRALPAEAVDRALAWRQGMIDLEGLTLAAAAAEFARYGGAPIRVPQQLVAARKVTGLFSASDPAGFARAAALSLGLEVRSDGNTISIVEPGR